MLQIPVLSLGNEILQTLQLVLHVSAF